MMKHLSLLLLAASAATAAWADPYVTPGAGASFTFADIAAASPCVTASGNVFTVHSDFTVSAGDTLRLLSGQQVSFADRVEIDVEGVLDFRPATSALVTRATADAAPKGFRVTGDHAVLLLRNTTFQYVTFHYMSDQPVTAENCTFSYANTSLTSTAAFSFSHTTVGNRFIGCRFLQNESAAIGGGAMTGMGLRIEDCYFYDNNTSNVNKPQLNLIGGGEDSIVIRRCTFIGTGRTMVGAIGFMNYYVPGSNHYIIEDNVIQGHRYGIGAYSYQYPLHFVVRNNVIINNNAETNPDNGGSGLSFYDYGSGMMNVYAEGNRIEGNLWGVTVLGSVGEINFGKTDDPSAPDYNPGRNVFVANGNGGQLYDFFNNTSNDAVLYAQGNLWGVAQQDSASIAEVVWDGHDQGGHGQVIFWSAPEAPASDACVPATFDDLAVGPDSLYRSAQPLVGGAQPWQSGDYQFTTYVDATYAPACYYYDVTVSALRDSSFTNDFSVGYDMKSAAGGAARGSNYAVWNNNYYGSAPVRLARRSQVSGMYVTNNTYAKASMLQGDAYARQFTTGDWFKLTVTGYRSESGADQAVSTVEFYLADFREADDWKMAVDWMWLDLTPLGQVDALGFELSSSDSGQWGMNTPAYFCFDELGVPAPSASADYRHYAPSSSSLESHSFAPAPAAAKQLRGHEIQILREGRSYDGAGRLR